MDQDTDSYIQPKIKSNDYYRNIVSTLNTIQNNFFNQTGFVTRNRMNANNKQQQHE